MISFLGPEGTFTHEAALKHFEDNSDSGSARRFIPAASIPAVFDSVSQAQSQWGVVPIENSIEGGVTFTLDQLMQSDVTIQAEVFVDIEQCLMSSAKDYRSVERVHSHPQGLAQCRQWLHAHLPQAQFVPELSTALAAYNVKGNPKAAAIASRLAAKLAEVPIVEPGIQDRSPNVTRFVVLGRASPEASGNDKTSLAFSTRHERGALFRALQVFDKAELNLSRIESRPSGEKTWRYVFFVDLEGHRTDPPVTQALQALAAHSDRIRILGSYPRS